MDEDCLKAIARYDCVIDVLSERIKKLEAALDLYRQAIQFDATMEGPKYKGANGSALIRAWKYDCATFGGKK